MKKLKTEMLSILKQYLNLNTIFIVKMRFGLAVYIADLFCILFCLRVFSVFADFQWTPVAEKHNNNTYSLEIFLEVYQCFSFNSKQLMFNARHVQFA